MDWPLTSETPLPHLSSLVYFHRPSQPSCSPPPRPVPPTPHRMKTYAMESKETEAARHRKRYSAASAIPRPTSGTSRRATPLGHPHVNASPDDEYVQAPPRSYRKSFHSTEGMPPSAWASSKARLPRSDSLLPYALRPPQDLSGTKQQLQIRHYSTQSLSSPSKIGLPRDSPLTSSSLPKSQSTVALSPPSRDVTPRRRLMKPLSPPLPKSQTFSNLSCTSFPATTPSPIKLAPTRMPLSVCSSYSQVNVVDALRESRMTEEEIMKWKQVQMEAAANQGRLRNTFEIRQHKQKIPATYASPTPSSFARTAEEATINLSANDYANTTRLEEQRRKSAGGRPMFINSVLANAYQTDTSLSYANTIASTASVGPEMEWESNLKHVRGLFFVIATAHQDRLTSKLSLATGPAAT
jgi:hypothetical protein